MIEVYFDGGCKPNPGMMEIAVVIAGETNLTFHDRLGMGTNNQAEWLSLLAAMIWLIDKEIREATFIGDSALVVNQANGTWKCNHPDLRKHLDEFKVLRRHFDQIKLKHVLRDKNLAGHVIEEVN
jgi:ribonuclease HI